MTLNINELVDINDIKIDNTLPKPERINEYRRQIKDPHHYKCGGLTVKAKFSDNGVTLEDCLQSLIT